MPRLTNPDSGVTVSVSEERAKTLTARGYRPAEEKKATAKKAAAKIESK